VNAYGIPDEPQIWVLVAGQISSHDRFKLRMPWGHIANAAKNMGVINLAQGHKKAALEQLNQNLADAIGREIQRQKEEGNGSAQEDNSELPQTDAMSEQTQAEVPETSSAVQETPPEFGISDSTGSDQTPIHRAKTKFRSKASRRL
jgi:hypothetical protein